MLNIGTLATWLSVAGFGSVAVIVPNRQVVSDAVPGIAESRLMPLDFTLGGESSPAAVEPAAESGASSPPEAAETLPAPPAMPDPTEWPALPSVPEPPTSPQSIRETTPAPRPVAHADSRERSPRRVAGQAATSAATMGTPGTGMSNAARLAAGSMPPPSYPAEARRQGQTGTLLVEFTVDASGRVIAAYAISPSPWPLLNLEAVSTVRSWRFPPGPVMKLQRPIVFQLR